MVKFFYQNKLEIFFYSSASGNLSVRAWLKKFSKEDKKIIGEDIKTVQFGWPLGMPLVRNMKNGLWEIRSNLDRRIARIIFIIHSNRMILLHGFIKKTLKTQTSDINLALKRKNDFLKANL